MKVNREDFPTMPDDELRPIYKNRLRIRKMLSAPPIIISGALAAIYFLAGFFNLTIFNTTLNNPVLPVLIPVFFFLVTLISGMLMFNDEPKTHFVAAIAVTAVQAAVFACGIALDALTSRTYFYFFICTLLSAVGHSVLVPVLSDLIALRECPSFPFDNYRRSLTYQSGIRGSSADANAPASVRATDLDSIFTTSSAEQESSEDTENLYKEDFFQQHDIDYIRKA